MLRPGWAPPEVDLERPSAARVDDCFLGRRHDDAVDRAAGDAAVGRRD